MADKLIFGKSKLIFGRGLFDFVEGTVMPGKSPDSFQIMDNSGLMLLESFHGIIPEEFVCKKVTIKYSKSRVDQRPRVVIVMGAGKTDEETKLDDKTLQEIRDKFGSVMDEE